MFDFFKGWRRKAGCATLMLACVFAAGWIRSLRSSEYIFMEFEIPIRGRIHVYTSSNQVTCNLQRSTGWYFGFGKVDPIVELIALDGGWFFDIQPIEEEIVGGVLQVGAGYEVRFYFYAVVVPLTLLSAILILWPSRGAKPSPN